MKDEIYTLKYGMVDIVCSLKKDVEKISIIESNEGKKYELWGDLQGNIVAKEIVLT